MYTYREQIELLEPIKIKEGQTKRINCPFCGGFKTMGVTNKDGAKVWHCFKASCGVRGSQNVGVTLGGLQRRLSSGTTTVKKPAIDLPANLSNPRFHPEAMRYLESVNSLQAFEDGLVEVKYSPALKRVIFMMPDKKGGVGRSLTGEKPKWKNFGDTSGLLTIGSGSTAVLVEDAASAASVSRFSFCSGCALLGTNISYLQRHQLLHFTKVIVALDKDASSKALRIKSKLEGRVPTEVLFIEEDLKWLNFEQLRKVLEGRGKLP